MRSLTCPGDGNQRKATEGTATVHSDPGQPGAITPVPRLPNGSSVVAELIEDLFPFTDDGTEGLQHLVARIPLLLEVQRASIGLLSTDGHRFTITQATSGDWPDLLGYTQSVSRLPAFVRGSLRSGVQGTVEDAVTFPFTPQQRKMLCYAGIGATVFTPIPTVGGIAGALVVDQMATQRPWDTWTLDSCKSLAEAIGARIALARNGDHLVDEYGEAPREAARINVLANLAELIGSVQKLEEANAQLVELLEGLPWVGAVRLIGPDEESKLIAEALANERIVARTIGAKTIVAIPLLNEGERFGGIEVMLDERLTDADQQFWTIVQHYGGSACASAARRGRPRDMTLLDTLTGLGNYRAIVEMLTETVYAARSSGRPVGLWIIDVKDLDAINRGQGITVGDDVLRYVGHTLGSVVAPRGMVGRLGGGEFLAVFPGMEGDEATVQARMMVERVTKNAPQHLPPVGLAIGVSSYPQLATNPDDLVRSARLALYAAKSRASSSVEIAKLKDEAWLRDARAAFVRISGENLLPASLNQLRK
jgi:diguanylate cyclase (GGDEF)-like protein